ncbi:MAG TPA: hypothetical protein DCM05_09210 [Elusimicrobia bacterium]|nr:hypothetical protein [Elusimicrobiota bacterium]
MERSLCPHCSADILRVTPDCWLCHRPLPAELVEKARVEAVLSAPMTVGGKDDLDSSSFGLLFLIACLIAGGFTLSPKLGAMFAALLLPAVLWLLMDHAPARKAAPRDDSAAAAWTVAALILLPISLALALVSTGVVVFGGSSVLSAVH